ncbi:hypothetical protein [Streptomyces sp. NBC_00826]|uniref:hypothetical protein n=1 Tax=Streptomyces sp. NBC_00826 TaxID=2975845 RepID=UPI0038651A7F|nr:hypothetical protein OG832_06670 [Streptomyces sp. NBC_00826]
MSQRTNTRPGNPPDAVNEPPSATVLRLAEELRSTAPDRGITDGDLAAIAVQVSMEDLAAVAEQVSVEGLAVIADLVSVRDLEVIGAQVPDDELARIAAAAPDVGRYVAARVLGAMPKAEPGETRGSYGVRLARGGRR